MGVNNFRNSSASAEMASRDLTKGLELLASLQLYVDSPNPSEQTLGLYSPKVVAANDELLLASHSLSVSFSSSRRSGSAPE